MGAQHSQMPLSQEREIQSSVLSRFAAGVTLPPGRLMCVDISCCCLLQSGWPVVFLPGCGLFGWWCAHQHGGAYHRCGEIVPTWWRSLRGSTVGFRVWLLEQNAQYEVGSTERCVLSMFCSLCGKEVNGRRHQHVAIGPRFCILNLRGTVQVSIL